MLAFLKSKGQKISDSGWKEDLGFLTASASVADNDVPVYICMVSVDLAKV